MYLSFSEPFVLTIFWLFWNQIKFNLVPNQTKNVRYNLIPVISSRVFTLLDNQTFGANSADLWHFRSAQFFSFLSYCTGCIAFCFLVERITIARHFCNRFLIWNRIKKTNCQHNHIPFVMTRTEIFFSVYNVLLTYLILLQ